MHVEVLHFGLQLLGLLDGLWSRIVEEMLRYRSVSLLTVVVETRYCPGWWLRVRIEMEIVLRPVVRGIVGDPL
jgi:hypothetical protein